MFYLTTLLTSIILTIAVMPYSRELAIKLHAMDEPSARKVHDHVMPKCGGLAMVIGAMTPVMLWAPKTPAITSLLIGSAIIVLFGVADDMNDLKPVTKLVGQVLAALVVILVGDVIIADLGSFLPEGVFLPDWAAIPLTIIVIVGVTNATNLSDGLDGLAGGLALMIYICLTYLAITQSAWPLAMIAIALSGSIFGFLRFNSHPAQLFMGDAGSQLLGFVAVVLAIKTAQESGTISVTLPLIIFGIPVLDTLTVMTRRLAKGQSPFRADRNHFHHQLMTIGLFHTEAVFTLYAAQALLIFFALVAHDSSDWFLLIAYLCFAAAVLFTFYHFQKTGYQVRRDGWINRIKVRLKPLKDRGRIIKQAFGLLRIGVASLLIVNALLPVQGSDVFLFIGAGFLLLLVLVWLVDRKNLNRIAKMVFYLATPFLVFNFDQTFYAHLGNFFAVTYNLLFLLLLASIILTLRFTRRTQGFKISTLDFLVIFIILLIPNLPHTGLQSYQLGLVAIKTVILYYGYEVIAGELRKDSLRFTVSTVALVVGLNAVVTLGVKMVG